MPQATLKKLDQANGAKVMASPKDVSALKLAIAKKVVSNYLNFREANPGSNLSPGREVYKNITLQVKWLYN